MKIACFFLALFTFLGLAVVAHADVFAVSTPAIAGYDVVSYHTHKRPLRGTGHYIAEHAGATYLFASQENLEKFRQDPEPPATPAHPVGAPAASKIAARFCRTNSDPDATLPYPQSA